MPQEASTGQPCQGSPECDPRRRRSTTCTRSPGRSAIDLTFYDGLGAIHRGADTVRQTLSEAGSRDVREACIDTGHPYWCMLAFAALWKIDANDEFWTVPEEPLPVERADFLRPVRPAGWLLAGDAASVQVQRHFPADSGGPPKYTKYLYGTHFPVNVGGVDGDIGPEAALCITDGTHWTHAGPYQQVEVGERWLRGRGVLHVGPHEVEIETVLAPFGQAAVRVHRLSIPSGPRPAGRRGRSAGRLSRGGWGTPGMGCSDSEQ